MENKNGLTKTNHNINVREHEKATFIRILHNRGNAYRDLKPMAAFVYEKRHVLQVLFTLILPPTKR